MVVITVDVFLKALLVLGFFLYCYGIFQIIWKCLAFLRVCLSDITTMSLQIHSYSPGIKGPVCMI